ncbi:hypothetical protein MATR_21160 [Marivirga tractuosa]|uniref:Uncharacterized protein n=1 Tax=Marivirga tractuosa (strain ATCC 23168 / DSM 4126 / NBRC 15989 / NCIMB 1408 / VKM B-1430 / H-43) TaxID=643867 RepID=E4TLX6_MARTH|nr:hypothetical protein [Marivirga tractuosa]ADR20267.1 hypothetical protein Ftrac_0258 [Marivirga tractuosa DSM 4126]BDD15291.1 hypothetical protein MATR_21160 [Marivirga tractuosa]
MKKETSKSRYFFNLAYTFFGGVMFAFVLGSTIWSIIQREKDQDNTIDYIEDFKIDFGDRNVMGKSYQDVIRYRLRFSNDKSWGSTVIRRRTQDWETAKVKFYNVLEIDTTKLLERIPFELDDSYFKDISNKGIIGVWEEKKGWQLLKIGDEYLVNGSTSSIGTFLLYAVFVLFVLLGIFFMLSPIALLLIDTKGLKTFDNLSYQSNKWDGIKYILNGFKNPDDEKDQNRN